jgi:hypothetical protein
MKQQAIKEKLQRSIPEKQSKHPENYASTFCPPSSEIDAAPRSEQSDILWPTAGSKVRVRLDSDCEIRGFVMGDEVAAAELRLSGLIGVQTEDGHFIEVPHPDENIIVTHNYGTPSSSFSVSRNSTGLDVSLKSTSASQGSETAITMSSWHLEQHGSEWMKRTPIGKRLSSNSEIRGENISSETNAFSEGNCDDNDDVEWVDGIEGLSAKAKKRKIRGADGDDVDDSDDSDEEEVHWQTPNDSAEIDIEVMNCFYEYL